MTLAERKHDHYISNVWGTCNDDDVVFRRNHGAKWQGVVPCAPDGVFDCEIWAENEAGNTSYIMKTLFAITGHELRIRPIRDTCYHAVETKHHGRRRYCGDDVCNGEKG